ncbi:phenylacetyl- ligase [Colletotrichum kahawae]|uniref:Phenylacetyl- ligase n=1 Tax=Colletotrichum kahawae TaxID=34407 RepID=A0AAE0DAV9_COLKA|nr:phenylacetyl- ligase [Colletotrichum kahawae]
MYRSPYPEPFVPSDVSVSQFLLSSNPDDVPPDQQILSDFDNQEQTLTIQELHSHAARDASTLISRFGLREGDVFSLDFRSSKENPVPTFNLSTRDNRKVPAGMCFSSGTSGKPKGVVFSHHNLIAYLLTLRATNPFTHNAYMREAFFPSFAHIYGIVSGVLLPAWVGNHVQPMRKFEYLPYLRRCSELKATVLRLVPAAAVRMVKDTAIMDLDLSSVHTVMCSGAPLSDTTVKGLKQLLGPETNVLNGYGMSEATITLLRHTRNGKKGASVGKPAAGVTVRVVDDNFDDVPMGIEGECLVKGPTVFLEYKNSPTETASTFRDGWLCTGDVVKVDEDGFFWLTGRKKELIKYKGNQIAPAELEAILLSYPSVTDAGVCGMAWGGDGEEVPIGFVCLPPSTEKVDHSKTLDEIRIYMEERVAPYKRLRGGLHFLESLPKNNSAKLIRSELAAIASRIHQTKARL